MSWGAFSEDRVGGGWCKAARAERWEFEGGTQRMKRFRSAFTSAG